MDLQTITYARKYIEHGTIGRAGAPNIYQVCGIPIRAGTTTVNNGQSEYKHTNGEISQVRIEMAGMGTRRVRIANLPLEITEGTIRSAVTIR